MLFNEPKLLKFSAVGALMEHLRSFSALQRAEIAEIWRFERLRDNHRRFSALQRAEIAEIQTQRGAGGRVAEFQCSSTSRNC